MSALSCLVPLLVFALILALAGWIIYRILKGAQDRAILAYQARQEQAERQRRAVWAGATVINLRHPLRSTEAGQAGQPVRIELSLRVRPPAGEPYLANATWMAEGSALESLQPGQEISVKIDPDDPRVIYPNLSGVQPAGEL